MMPIVVLLSLVSLSPAAEKAAAEVGYVEFYQGESELASTSSEAFLIRVFEYQKNESGERSIRFVGDLGGHGVHRFRVPAAAGRREYVVIVEDASRASEVSPGETRSLPRLQPNVKAEVENGSLTRVRIGLAGGLAQDGFDSRSNSARGEARRVPASGNTLSFESPDASRGAPGASQFATSITVSKPEPLDSSK